MGGLSRWHIYEPFLDILLYQIHLDLTIPMRPSTKSQHRSNTKTYFQNGGYDAINAYSEDNLTLSQ
jgi:hypothetical protein